MATLTPQSERSRSYIPARPGGRHRVGNRRVRENTVYALFSHTAVLVGRILTRWSRDPAATAETVLVPAAFLVTLNIVLGNGLTQVLGFSPLYASVPLVAMVAATQGATVGGLGLMRERDEGLLSRLWVVPMHRAAGLVARLTAEMIRIFVATIVLGVLALVLGFRFQQGFFATVAWFFIPCIFGLAFAILVATLALYSAKTIVVEATALISGVLMFFSTGFVPLSQYPEWLQPIVKNQPLSNTVEVMKGLSIGGPIASPMGGLLIWSLAIIVICVVPMGIAYKKACTRG